MLRTQPQPIPPHPAAAHAPSAPQSHTSPQTSRAKEGDTKPEQSTEDHKPEPIYVEENPEPAQRTGLSKESQGATRENSRGKWEVRSEKGTGSAEKES